MQELLESEDASVRDVRASVVEGTVVRTGPRRGLAGHRPRRRASFPVGNSPASRELGHAPRVGDRILVYVVTTENTGGARPALLPPAPGRAVLAPGPGAGGDRGVVEAKVLEVNRGGVVVDFGTRALSLSRS